MEERKAERPWGVYTDCVAFWTVGWFEGGDSNDEAWDGERDPGGGGQEGKRTSRGAWMIVLLPGVIHVQDSGLEGGYGKAGYTLFSSTPWFRNSTISSLNARVLGSTQDEEGRVGLMEKEGMGMEPGRRRRRSAQR